MGKSVFEECVWCSASKGAILLFRYLTGMPPGYLLHDKFWEDAFGTRHAAKIMSLGRLRRTVLEKVEAVKCSYCCFCDIDLDEQQKMD